MNKLDKHNQLVNDCRSKMCRALEMASIGVYREYAPRCKSNGWGKRGKDATRRSRLRYLESKTKTWERSRGKMPKVIKSRKLWGRMPTAYSALRFLCVQQEVLNEQT